MRTNARECAYKIIFANLFHPADDATKRSVYKANELSEEDAAFAEQTRGRSVGASDGTLRDHR